MRKIVLEHTQIWIHQKESAEKAPEYDQQVMQRIADIAYETLLTEYRQKSIKSNV